MSEYLSVFKNNSYQEKVYKAYDEIMAIWPVPFDELFISTGFGETHIIACGCEKSPPLILFHALYASAASWYKNVEGLSKIFRVYCVDIIGDPNKSRPIKHIRQLNDFVDWISALLDGLQVKQAFFVGNSVGAFHVVNYAIKVPERVISMVLIGPAATFRQIMPFYINTFPGAITSWSLLIDHAIKWIENGIPFDPMWKKLFYLIFKCGVPTNQVFPIVFGSDQLKRINIPTLLIYGDRENIYNIELSIKYAQNAIENIKIEIIPGANHLTALTQPTLTNEAILRFFEITCQEKACI